MGLLASLSAAWQEWTTWRTDRAMLRPETRARLLERIERKRRERAS